MTQTLSIIALISAVLAIWARLQNKDSLQFVFKPLTMSAIILLALLNSSSPVNFYQKAILVGLIFSTVGDIFLIKQERFFVQGLIFFLVGHLCYIAAFWTNPNWLSGLIHLVYLVSFLTILWKVVGKLKAPVFVYATAIAVMSWMASSRAIESFDYQNGRAFIGAALFVISDSLLAYNKFKSPIPYAHLWILSAYFLAQWFIALSL